MGLFCGALRLKLADRTSGLGKEYLRQLLSEIRVDGNQARIRGSESALATAVSRTELGGTDAVPSFGMGWLPDLGSNQGPAD